MKPQADHFLAALADQLKAQDRATVAEMVMKRAVEIAELRLSVGKLSAELVRFVHVDIPRRVKEIEAKRDEGGAADDELGELIAMVRSQCVAAGWDEIRIQQLQQQLASCEKALAESHAREMSAKPIETSYTRAELAAAVDAAHALLHDGRSEEAHEALHEVGAGKERVGSATRDPEAQRMVGELVAKLEGTGLPCGHRLADLIGGQGQVTKCGACLAGKRAAKPASSGEEFRPGLPPEALRAVHAEWDLDCGYTYRFNGDMFRGLHWDESMPSDPLRDNPKILRTSKFRPHAAAWPEIERKAAAALGKADAKEGKDRRLFVDIATAVFGEFWSDGNKVRRAYDEAYDAVIDARDTIEKERTP